MSIKNAISLFSGAGGDTCGLERAGFKVVAYNEFNEYAILTHQKEHPDSQLIVNPINQNNDITKIDDSVFIQYADKIDLIFAGFPCQGFSHAGKKKVNDKRNELVYEFARVVNIVKPKWIIGENVKGLLSRKGKEQNQNENSKLKPVIDIISDLFNKIGYKITYKVIDCKDVGVPQNRKRLIIVGHRGDLYPHMPWDNLTPSTNPDVHNIRSFLQPHLNNALEMRDIYKSHEQSTNYWIITNETTPTGTPHKNLERLMNGIRNISKKEKEINPSTNQNKQIIEQNGLISFGVRKGGYHGMVLNPDVPCNTIISTYNLCPRLFVGLHNPTINKYWVRCMTPSELGQIQGFPENYQWQGPVSNQIIQIGNAVPPTLAERIAKSIENIEFKDYPQNIPNVNQSDDDEEDDE